MWPSSSFSPLAIYLSLYNISFKPNHLPFIDFYPFFVDEFSNSEDLPPHPSESVAATPPKQARSNSQTPKASQMLTGSLKPRGMFAMTSHMEYVGGRRIQRRVTKSDLTRTTAAPTQKKKRPLKLHLSSPSTAPNSSILVTSKQTGRVPILERVDNQVGTDHAPTSLQPTPAEVQQPTSAAELLTSPHTVSISIPVRIDVASENDSSSSSEEEELELNEFIDNMSPATMATLIDETIQDLHSEDTNEALMEANSKDQLTPESTLQGDMVFTSASEIDSGSNYSSASSSLNDEFEIFELQQVEEQQKIEENQQHQAPEMANADTNAELELASPVTEISSSNLEVAIAAVVPRTTTTSGGEDPCAVQITPVQADLPPEMLGRESHQQEIVQNESAAEADAFSTPVPHAAQESSERSDKAITGTVFGGISRALAFATISAMSQNNAAVPLPAGLENAAPAVHDGAAPSNGENTNHGLNRGAPERVSAPFVDVTNQEERKLVPVAVAVVQKMPKPAGAAEVPDAMHAAPAVAVAVHGDSTENESNLESENEKEGSDDDDEVTLRAMETVNHVVQPGGADRAVAAAALQLPDQGTLAVTDMDMDDVFQGEEMETEIVAMSLEETPVAATAVAAAGAVAPFENLPSTGMAMEIDSSLPSHIQGTVEADAVMQPLESVPGEDSLQGAAVAQRQLRRTSSLAGFTRMHPIQLDQSPYCRPVSNRFVPRTSVVGFDAPQQAQQEDTPTAAVPLVPAMEAPEEAKDIENARITHISAVSGSRVPVTSFVFTITERSQPRRRLERRNGVAPAPAVMPNVVELLEDGWWGGGRNTNGRHSSGCAGVRGGENQRVKNKRGVWSRCVATVKSWIGKS